MDRYPHIRVIYYRVRKHLDSNPDAKALKKEFDSIFMHTLTSSHGIYRILHDLQFSSHSIAHAIRTAVLAVAAKIQDPKFLIGILDTLLLALVNQDNAKPSQLQQKKADVKKPQQAKLQSSISTAGIVTTPTIPSPLPGACQEPAIVPLTRDPKTAAEIQEGLRSSMQTDDSDRPWTVVVRNSRKRTRSSLNRHALKRPIKFVQSESTTTSDSDNLKARPKTTHSDSKLSVLPGFRSRIVVKHKPNCLAKRPCPGSEAPASKTTVELLNKTPTHTQVLPEPMQSDVDTSLVNRETVSQKPKAAIAARGGKASEIIPFSDTRWSLGDHKDWSWLTPVLDTATKLSIASHIPITAHKTVVDYLYHNIFADETSSDS